jgi:uncharacterized protein (TIGR02466 family)
MRCRHWGDTKIEDGVRSPFGCGNRPPRGTLVGMEPGDAQSAAPEGATRSDATAEVVRELYGLFPVPLRRVKRLLGPELVAGLVQHFAASAKRQNSFSQRLSHTELATPAGHTLFGQADRLIVPELADFGELLLGERLPWSIKEIWVNVLDAGGRQSVHNHSNSFISGIVYLTGSHPSANTVFVKAVGSQGFIFDNTNARTKLGPHNAHKWVAPDPAPGDLLLFPSYLLHEVPKNQGDRRISMAFNSIPERLDSWGYTLTLSR